MSLTKLKTVAIVAVLAIGCAGVAPATFADSYPSKPVRMIIPFAAGGALDAPARPIAEEFRKATGQSLVIENLGGAGGVIAATQVVRSPPDGYTLMLGNSGQTSTARYAHASLAYDPRADLVPVVHVSDSAVILYVSARSPYQTVADLVAAAKARPNEVSFAHGGIGGISHLAIELFAHQAGVKFNQIPYKGVGAAMQDIGGGRVEAVFTFISTAQPYVDSKLVRPLAVAAPRRLPTLPDVPTFAEAGLPKVSVSMWIGIMAPRGTPTPVVEKIASVVDSALRNPELRKRLEAQGMEVGGGTPADLKRVIDQDFLLWEELAKVVDLAPK